MDFLSLCQDYGIEYAGEEDKHQREGWVNIACPFCSGHDGFHLGYNTYSNIFSCWRCGRKGEKYVLKRILGSAYSEEVLEIYGGYVPVKEENIKKVGQKKFMPPSPLYDLQEEHIAYLKNRGMNVEKIKNLWNIKATGPTSKIDKMDYSNRIYIPIVWNGKEVSYQCRSIYKARIKYKACPKERERIEHQTILYGKQEAWNGIGICVEGVVDVWNFGVKAFCTFGIGFTQAQVIEISKHFKKVCIVFDNEVQAQEKAKQLASELNFRGVKSIIYTIEGGDPGEQSKENIKIIRKLIINKLKSI